MSRAQHYEATRGHGGGRQPAKQARVLGLLVTTAVGEQLLWRPRHLLAELALEHPADPCCLCFCEKHAPQCRQTCFFPAKACETGPRMDVPLQKWLLTASGGRGLNHSPRHRGGFAGKIDGGNNNKEQTGKFYFFLLFTPFSSSLNGL